MNSVQLHLALTHVPVILSLTGLVMLIVAFLIKNVTLIKTTYIILLIAGVAALPVFLSGEGTEEAVEHLPGVSENLIQQHEEVAQMAMISVAVSGAIAFVALLLNRFTTIARFSRVFVLVGAFISGALMAQTAHLGGQIRHTEVRNGVAVNQGNELGGEHDD